MQGVRIKQVRAHLHAQIAEMDTEHFRLTGIWIDVVGIILVYPEQRRVMLCLHLLLDDLCGSQASDIAEAEDVSGKRCWRIHIGVKETDARRSRHRDPAVSADKGQVDRR